jgi:hypothetical protein
LFTKAVPTVKVELKVEERDNILEGRGGYNHFFFFLFLIKKGNENNLNASENCSPDTYVQPNIY